MRGHYLEPITDDLKERFLDLVAEGYSRQAAAKALDASPRQFRSLCNPESHRYDDDFARRYEHLTEKDGERDQGKLEMLEDAAFERAIRSSDPLLIKLLTIYSKDWEIHRPQAMQINFNKTEQLAVILPELSDEEILQLRQRIENNMRQIGPPDIDAP